MKEHIDNKLSVRAEFEAWYVSNYGENEFLRGSGNDFYFNASIDFAYQAWKAGIDSSEAKLSAVPANNPWQQAIDDELVNTHLGIAQDGVTREEAKEKLNNLIAWHIDVAKYFDAQAQQPKQEPMIVKTEKYIRAKLDAPEFHVLEQEPVSSNEHVKQESKLTRDEIFKIYCEDKNAGDWHRPQENYQAGYRKGFKDSQP
jgi:hypothetical protein